MASKNLVLVGFKGTGDVSAVCGHINVLLDRILVKVTLRNTHTDQAVNNEIILGDVLRELSLDFVVVPEVLKVLIPLVECLCVVDLSCPIVNQVKIVVAEIACL